MLTIYAPEGQLPTNNEYQSSVAFLRTVHYEREDLKQEERWGAVKH